MEDLSDLEMLHADLFTSVGLGQLSVEERAPFLTTLNDLFGLVGIIRSLDCLQKPADEETLGRLLDKGEGERARAFLMSRGIDIQRIVFEEALAVKRRLLKTGHHYAMIAELEQAIRFALAPDVLGPVTELEKARAETDIEAYIDGMHGSLGFKTELKKRAIDLLGDRAIARILDALPEEAVRQLKRLLGAGQQNEATVLLAQHGVDRGKVYLAEAAVVIEALKGAAGS